MQHCQGLKTKAKSARYMTSITVSWPLLMKDSPPKFWHYLSTSIPPLCRIQVNEQCIDYSDVIAYSFNEYFASSVNDNCVTPSTNYTNLDLPDITTTSEGVLSALQNLDPPKKSPGVDEIPNQFLICYSEWYAKYLRILFVKSLQFGTVLSETSTSVDITNFHSISHPNFFSSW